MIRRTVYGLLLALALALQAIAAPALPSEHGDVPAADWMSVQTARFNLFYTDHSPAEADIQQLMDLFEQDLDKVVGVLHVQPQGRLSVLLYPDELKVPKTAPYYVTSAHRDIIHVNYEDKTARNMTIHGGANDYFIAPLAQAMAYQLNPTPSFLLARGLALFLADYAGTKLSTEQRLNRELGEGDLLPLADVNKPQAGASDRRWRLTNLEAESFARYLIETYGLTRYLEAFRLARPDTLPEALQQAYGRTFTRLEQDFQADLQHHSLPPTETPHPQRHRHGNQA